jgi:hypothetical protein
LIRVDPWIASNHYTFFSRGVPTIAFSSSGYAEVLHAADDTLALINPARIEQVADVILDLIAAFEDKSPAWSRPPVSAEVKT